MNPKARRNGLLVEEVGEELTIYDRERDHTCHLNRVAATVWRCCDGNTSVSQIAEHLRRTLGADANDDLVLLALERLHAAYLLDEIPEVLSADRSISRRSVLVAVALAALLPVVAIISASQMTDSPSQSPRPREDVGPGR